MSRWAVPTIRDLGSHHLPSVVEIYNDAVRNTTAIWNEVEVDLENRRAWWEARRADGFPVLVAEGSAGVAGYATFGPFRPFDGYRHTVEHSVYVAAGERGQGFGGLLLEALIVRAAALGKHVMIGGIDASNEASLRLHRRHGFVEAGRLPECGQKFGRWLDLVFMHRKL